MCGFVCVVTKRPLSDTLDVSGFDRDVLRHRGPDSSGELVMENAYVRHWRLSIVDVTVNADQPYGDGDSWLIYNGEIYNYDELGRGAAQSVRGDTALIYRWCKEGVEEQRLKRARGFYSYLYLRERGLVLSGGRDPFGKKPLFYYIDNEVGIAAFASEEKAIVDCLKDRQIDFTSVSQYLLYKTVFRGRSHFKNISQLAPGAHVHLDARNWSFSVDYDWDAYYQKPAADVFAVEPDAAARRAAADGRLADVAYDALQESFTLRMPREVSACVALSGGIDSSMIAQMAASAPPLLANISQFITVGFEDPGCDESPRAAEIAGSLGVTAKHAIVPFPQRELLAYLIRCVEQASAPLEHPHYLSYYALCRHAATLSKVLITGEGADELFMGYEHYAAPGRSFAFREYLTADDERCFGALTPGAFPFDAIRRDAGVGALRARALGSPMASREYELKTHLLSLLDRNDKMGMANSVEIRAPFLDREILALCLALSDSDLVVDGSPKYVMKQMFARCFPDVRAQDKKIGFRVPFDELFLEGRRRGPMRDYCEIAVRALRDECGLTLRSVDEIAPRLGWSLLNIGVFLDTQGAAS